MARVPRSRLLAIQSIRHYESPIKQRYIFPPVSTEQALPIAAVTPVIATLGIATETQTALDMYAISGDYVFLGTAEATEQALPIGVAVGLLTAVETSSALAISVSIPVSASLGTATETDAAQPVTANLVSLTAYYRMQSITDNILVDASSNGHDGTLFGAVSLSTGTIEANAIRFDDSSEYATLPQVFNHNQLPFSFASWVKHTTGSVRYIFRSNPAWGGDYGVRVYFNNSGWLQCSLGDGGDSQYCYNTSAKVSNGGWSHVALNINGVSDMEIWVNKVSYTPTYGGSASSFATDTDTPRLGGTPTHFEQTLIRWGQPLTQTEVDDHYAGTFTIP